MYLDLAPYFAAEEGIPFRDRWATMPWRNQSQSRQKALINTGKAF